MKNRTIKLIICVVLISCLMVGFCTTSHAIAGLGGAALLASGLAEIGVDLAVSAGVGYIGYELLNSWLNSNYSIKGALTGVADGYIKVGDSSVTIDGVQYESIFLDPSMAAELHTQLFDFVTAEAITSNSSGILATGKGFVAGEPVYQIGTNRTVTTSTYNLSAAGTYNIGDVTCTIVDNWSQTYPYRFISSYNGVDLTTTVLTGKVTQLPYQVRFEANLNGVYELVDGSDATLIVVNGYGRKSGTLTGAVSAEEFEYDYAAGVIDATPLPSDYGFQLYVPTGTLQQAGINSGTYVVGGVGEDTILQLIDILDTLNPDDIKEAEFTNVVVPPAPTPVPTDTPLSDVPYSQFVDTFGQSITDGLEDVNDTIGLYGEEIIDTVDIVGQSITDELGNVSDTVDTVGQSIVDELETVEGVIDTIGQSIETALDTAADAVIEAVDLLAATIDDVIEAIQTHPLDLFSNFLDRLANIPIIKSTFDSFKQHVGIWHYVVEWLTCVGIFLGFMIGVFSDTAYCMVVPIYACVAAAICLAFYKRFGR